MHTFTLVFFSNWMAGGKFGMSYTYSVTDKKHKPNQNNGNKEKFK